MDAMEALLTRRSVRTYLGKPIPKEIQKKLLSCAMSAPSANNEQPWHFIVIEDVFLLKKIPDIHPHAQMASHAPLAILVCGDFRLTKIEGFWVQDCAAATQNLLLAAHCSGIGAVWTGIFPRHERVESFQKLLSLPKEVLPFSLVVLGYPDKELPQADRYLAERIHLNQW